MLLLLLLSLNAFGDDHNTTRADMTIVVEDRAYEEIYVEPPTIFCEERCPASQWVENAVFIEAARKHKAWFKSGKVGAVYNKETIGLRVENCDFQRTPLKCGSENGIWTLRTTVVQDKNKSSIQLMLFDDNGIIIGQGSKEEILKKTIIERQRTTQQQLPSQQIIGQICPEGQQGCIAMPIENNNTSQQIEDLDPVVIENLPTLEGKHVSQAMIGVYDSITK